MSQPLQALAAQFLSPEWKTLLSPNEWFGELEAKLIEAMLTAELSHHLEMDARAGKKNFRNGYWKRMIPSRDGTNITIRVPRERAGRFESRLVPHHRRHFYGFTDRLLAIFAKGRDIAEIEEMLPPLYDMGLPRDLAPRITDAVLGVVREWQERTLDSSYKAALFAALPVTTRERKLTQDRPVFFALGLRADATSELLGLWVKDEAGEGAWQQILADLAARGVHHINAAITNELQCPPPISKAPATGRLSDHCELYSVHGFKELSAIAARQALIDDMYRAEGGGKSGPGGDPGASYTWSLASAPY